MTMKTVIFIQAITYQAGILRTSLENLVNEETKPQPLLRD